jgi:pimeloyl-ACP methyl ester carboxylesterase
MRGQMKGRDAGGQSRPTVLLVHGAWHGAWVWEKVQRELTARGWAVHTIDLPSVAERGLPRRGLHGDAAAVRQRIEEIEGPVVVVAHSYGGAVVTQGVADLPNVCHIVYVCAFALDVGESISTRTTPISLYVDRDIMPPDDARERFYQDMEPHQADWAITRLLPISDDAFSETLTSAAWQNISSTYVVCDWDAAVPPKAQCKFAARTTAIRHLAAGHSPMLSMPSELTDLIVDAAHVGCQSAV